MSEKPLPPLVAARDGAGRVLVTWIPPADDVAGFRVYCWQSGGPEHVNEVRDPRATSALVAIPNSGEWFFAVTAYNAAGEESERSNLGTLIA